MKKKSLLLLILVLVLAYMSAFSASAAQIPDQLGYLTDQADLLTAGEEAALWARAEEISEAYRCGVYIITVDDLRDFTDSGSVEICAEEFRTDYDLGFGAERNCILLLLSMAERDYDLCAYGDFANACFSASGRERLADTFLDDFGRDDWYAGFSDYLDEAEHLLRLSADGAPRDAGPHRALSPLWALAASALPAFGVALIICLVMRGNMRSVRAKCEARDYVPNGGVELTYRRDRFTHATHSRVYAPQSKPAGSGGAHRTSGGHSHSSGKF